MWLIAFIAKSKLRRECKFFDPSIGGVANRVDPHKPAYSKSAGQIAIDAIFPSWNDT